MGVMDGVSNPWISNFAVWPTDDIVSLYRFIMKAYTLAILSVMVKKRKAVNNLLNSLRFELLLDWN